jgi:hypothetical protein
MNFHISLHSIYTYIYICLYIVYVVLWFVCFGLIFSNYIFLLLRLYILTVMFKYFYVMYEGKTKIKGI